MDLAKEIWSEEAVLELLGVKRLQLANLRARHGLPAVRLARGVRVYLADEVLAWVQARGKGSGSDETSA
jgi:hypothetical protein